MYKNRLIKQTLCALGAASLLTFSACSKSDTKSDPVEVSEDAKILQALGYSVGQDILIGEFSAEEQADIIAGLKIAAEGGEFANIETLRGAAYAILQQKQSKIQQAASEGVAAVNKAAAEAYFAELDVKEGITKTESGLRYEVTLEGSDVVATKNSDVVHLHYHGTFIDGTVFESSVDRGQPISFPLNGVIRGFSEGLKLVGEGGKITLYMPSSIAYGDNPRQGGPIKPGMALIFEVELLKVNPE